MKLGICTYPYLYSMPVEESIASIGKLGFKYAELMTTPPHIWIRGMDKATRVKLRQTCEKSNVEVLAVNPTFLDINLVSQNIGIRRESIAQIKETFEFAGDLGAKLAVIMLGKRHTLIPAPYERTWHLAKEAILECLEYAAKNKVIFALENATGNFMTSVQEAVKMAAEINEPNFKIIYDAANGFFMNEDPAQALMEAAPYLAHVHISDTTKKTWGHQAIGSGQVDFAAVAEALRKINYQGITIFELTDDSVNSDEMYRNGYEQLVKFGWSK